MNKLKLHLWCLIFSIVSLQGCKHLVAENTITIAFYNCENLFDTKDAPTKDDDDFTPTGKYQYTEKIYDQKLHNIATVFQSMNNPYPTFIGLAEIENNTVLADLCNQPEIARQHYKFISTNGPDPRGINVGFLYNAATCTILSSESIPVVLNSGKYTRDILHVFLQTGNDSLHVYINHWPSRRGSDEENNTENKRALAAATLKNAIAKTTKNNLHAQIIVMGDFNDNPNDSSIQTVLNTSGAMDNTTIGALYNPWVSIYNNGAQGTEKFQNTWNLFDQIMLSYNLVRSTSHWHYNDALIYNPDFITSHNGGHNGEPHRSFAGTHWLNGYSDHFPVLVHLVK